MSCLQGKTSNHLTAVHPQCPQLPGIALGGAFVPTGFHGLVLCMTLFDPSRMSFPTRNSGSWVGDWIWGRL